MSGLVQPTEMPYFPTYRQLENPSYCGIRCSLIPNSRYNNKSIDELKVPVPVIFRQKGYGFFFVMFDLNEPMHVHVRQGRREAKYWMEPLKLAWNHGYRQHELNEIEGLIEDNHTLIQQAWQEALSKR